MNRWNDAMSMIEYLSEMVPCFYCGARVGIQCQTKTGKPVPLMDIHSARREFAYAEGWLPLDSGLQKLEDIDCYGEGGPR